MPSPVKREVWQHAQAAVTRQPQAIVTTFDSQALRRAVAQMNTPTTRAIAMDEDIEEALADIYAVETSSRSRRDGPLIVAAGSESFLKDSRDYAHQKVLDTVFQERRRLKIESPQTPR